MTSGTQESYLLNNSCYLTCPSPYFGRNSNHQCQLCHTNCDICYGSSNDKCTLCSNGFVQSGTTCDTTCISGYGVIDADPWNCLACNDTCLACAYDSLNCSSCQTTGNHTAFLFPNSSTYSECLTSCPSGWLEDSLNQTC